MRKLTRQIKVGDIKIGGGAPIVIQSMTKTDTRDVIETVRQIKELESLGCEMVRVAVKDLESADAIKNIKKRINIPLVADIHFDYRLAIRSIQSGADKIRLNPGNIFDREQIETIIRFAKKNHIPIRIGLNSGSMPDPGRMRFMKNFKCSLEGLEDWQAMVRYAMNYISMLEKMDFYDIIVSLKAADVLTTIKAYREFARSSNYPIHLGITAAGPVSTGLVKSSIGIGVLLLEGIGDTIRVSLTAGPEEEVIAAKNILQSLGIRRFGPDIISCPTCGRCQVDLQRIVSGLSSILKVQPSMDMLKIAIMGCEVNGPGEAKAADIGVAFGKGKGVIFKKGKILKRVGEKDAVKELLKEIR